MVSPPTTGPSAEERAELLRQKAGLMVFLAPDAPTTWAQAGDDSAIVANRRAVMLADLAAIEDRLQGRVFSASHELSSEEMGSALCFLNSGVNLNACIIDKSTTVKLQTGSGSVFTNSTLVANHSTVTSLLRDGRFMDQISTGGASFGFGSLRYSAPLSFEATNCSLSGHNLEANTTHNISFSAGIPIQGVEIPIGLTGEAKSKGIDSCKANGLTVSVDRNPIHANNDYTGINIGNVPDGCALRVVSSQPIIEIQDWGGGYWGAYSQGQTGNTTITASCSNGTAFGYTTLEVVADETCGGVTSKGLLQPVALHECTPTGDGGGGGGGGGDDECGWYVWEISYDGGRTWYQYGDPFWWCPGEDVGMIRKGLTRRLGTAEASSMAPKAGERRVGILGTTTGRPPYVYRSSPGAQPVVVVDLNTITAAGLEGALQSLTEVDAFAGPAGRPDPSRLVSFARPSGARSLDKLEADRALLDNLRKSATRKVPGVGSGLWLETSISRPGGIRKIR